MENNYPIKKLGEVCKIVGGGTPSKGNPKYWDGDIPWASVKDIKEGATTLERTEDFITEAGLKNSAANFIPAGTLIISTRMGLGRVVRTKIDTAINQDLKAIFPKPELDPDYLLHFLRSKARDFIEKGTGATVSGIRLEYLNSIQIPLPPLAEQKKIVERIEKQFAKIDEAIRLCAQTLAATEALLPATLHEIFKEGKQKGWYEKALGEICEIARGGSPRPIKDWLTDAEDGINWIKISDASESNKYIYVTKEKIRKEGLKKTRMVYPGDFVLTNSMSFGRPYIMQTTGAIHDGWLLLRPEDGIDREYLYYFLSSDEVYRQFEQLAGGAVVKNLNSNLVKGVKIAIPPLAEQKRIVKKLDALSEKVRMLRELQTRQLADLKKLKQAILREVFA